MDASDWDTVQRSLHAQALPEYLAFTQRHCFPAQCVTRTAAMRGSVERQGAQGQRPQSQYVTHGHSRTSAMVIADARIMPNEVAVRWEADYHIEVRRTEIACSLNSGGTFGRNDIIATASLIALRLPDTTAWAGNQSSPIWDLVKRERVTGGSRDLPASIHVYWTWED